MHQIFSILFSMMLAAHPLVAEPEREPPTEPPPARLFISNEARYAIQRGWLAGDDYDETKIATHLEAITMLMYMAGLEPDTPLTRQDFVTYLGYLFPHLPDEDMFEGVLTLHATSGSGLEPERPVTLAEMARVAYRLRGVGVVAGESSQGGQGQDPGDAAPDPARGRQASP
ncbi:MAG: hypothetical protein FWC71_11480 [Defluviitaleaceae bacterium]|nr:hypothetical protein [Defluviitaleaceae bacterium]